MTKSKDHLICFDLDGVLISTMIIANEIFYDVVSKELGLPLYDYPEQKSLMSLSFEDRLATLWRDDVKKLGITEEQIADALMLSRQRKLDSGTPIIPHAREAVELMAENFENLALVSSNSVYVIDETLKALGLREHFSKLTGIDDVRSSKPNPEIYAVTGEYFDIDPTKCLVFEDSSNGIHAAKGAGMKVIGVATGLESVEELEKTAPERIIRNFSELSMDLVNEVL